MLAFMARSGRPDRSAQLRRPALVVALAMGLGIGLAIASMVYLAWTTPAAPCTAPNPYPSRPLVGFSAPSAGPRAVSFQVVCAAPVAPIGSYGFTVQRNGGPAGPVTTLQAANQTVVVGNDSFYVAFRDVDDSGTFKAPDPFRVGLANGSAFPAGSYAFYLVWLGSANWYPPVTWTA